MEKEWVEDAEDSPQGMCGLLLIDPQLEKLADDPSVEANTRQRVTQYVKQIRESRGYDVDAVIPMPMRFFLQNFRLVYPEELMKKRFYARVMTGLNLAMENINAESDKAVGKTYEFVGFKKIIATPNSMFLYTFTARVHGTEVVKTLQAMVHVPSDDADSYDEPFFGEWRVKPVPDVAKSS